MTGRRRGEGTEKELWPLSLHCLVFLILYFGAFGNVNGSGERNRNHSGQAALASSFLQHLYQKGVVSRRESLCEKGTGL